MLTTISWKNVWRNPSRSLVVIIAIILGISGGVFLLSFSWGMNVQRAQNRIETEISHIQIHHPQFKEDQETKFLMPEGRALANLLSTDTRIRSVSSRLVVSGMIASAKEGAGIRVQGIIPESEADLTQLPAKLIEGSYFGEIKRNPIIIGQKLAEKLQVGLKKKVVLTFQDTEGEIVSGAFRIAGIFKTISSLYDNSEVFVRQDDLNKLLGKPQGVHEIALLLHDPEAVEDYSYRVGKPKSGPYLIEDWPELAPDLKLIFETFETMMRIFMGIIMLALAFGIINTMLMAILERRQELGMLMSVGMNRRRVFLMIMLETLFLSIVGGVLGLALAFGLVELFGTIGIDLSAMGDSLEMLGMDPIIYPQVEPKFYGTVAILVILTAFLSSLYPAYRALKLNPVEAVRAI